MSAEPPHLLLADGACSGAFVDPFHSSTWIMSFVDGGPADDGLRLRGTYGGELWGWYIAVTLGAALRITHDDVRPAGEVQRAIDVVPRR